VICGIMLSLVGGAVVYNKIEMVRTALRACIHHRIPACSVQKEGTGSTDQTVAAARIVRVTDGIKFEFVIALGPTQTERQQGRQMHRSNL